MAEVIFSSLRLAWTGVIRTSERSSSGLFALPALSEDQGELLF
jgi:hypothetical protein